METERGSSMADRSDLTFRPQTRDRTRQVHTLPQSILRTYFLLAWINSFGTCTVLTARDYEAHSN